jgi:hypothetical protein
MLLQEERGLHRMYSNRYLEFFRIWLHKKNEKKITRSFNVTFRYIDDVLSLDNSRFVDFPDRIYTIEFEIKNTTYTDRSASYLALHLEIDSDGRLKTKFYDKGYYFWHIFHNGQPSHGGDRTTFEMMTST